MNFNCFASKYVYLLIPFPMSLLKSLCINDVNVGKEKSSLVILTTKKHIQTGKRTAFSSFNNSVGTSDPYPRAKTTIIKIKDLMKS